MNTVICSLTSFSSSAIFSLWHCNLDAFIITNMVFKNGRNSKIYSAAYPVLNTAMISEVSLIPFHHFISSRCRKISDFQSLSVLSFLPKFSWRQYTTVLVFMTEISSTSNYTESTDLSHIGHQSVLGEQNLLEHFVHQDKYHIKEKYQQLQTVGKYTQQRETVILILTAPRTYFSL